MTESENEKIQKCVPQFEEPGVMNVVLKYARGKLSNPLRGYRYVHDSKLRQPRQIAATMYKHLPVTTVIAYSRLYI